MDTSIDYLKLGVRSEELERSKELPHADATDEVLASRLRILVALHAGYLTIKSVNTSGQTADIHVPNKEVSETALHIINKSGCLLYTSPSPRDQRGSRMPSSA